MEHRSPSAWDGMRRSQRRESLATPISSAIPPRPPASSGRFRGIIILRAWRESGSLSQTLADLMRRVFKLAVKSGLVLASVGLCFSAAPASDSNEPKLTSLNPLGGMLGTHFPALIRGENLQHPTGVWFDCDRLRASV